MGVEIWNITSERVLRKSNFKSAIPSSLKHLILLCLSNVSSSISSDYVNAVDKCQSV